MNAGVYTITQKSTGGRYVGSSVNLHTRELSHWWHLRNGVHRSPHLQNSFDKYGEADFIFKVLFFCDVDTILFYEQQALDILNPTFNILRVAGNCTGRTVSPETRLKISIGNSGKIRSPEQMALLRACNVGKSVSFETRSKISSALKGRKFTPEHRAKISAAMKGHRHGVGRVVTPETRSKISKASMGNNHCVGRIVSNETRAKISASKKARYATAC